MLNINGLRQARNSAPKMIVAGYTTDIILCKGLDGTLYCTKTGDIKTMDRDGANVSVVYSFASNGYPGHNVLAAIILPSGRMVVALTAYNDTLTFLRSTNAGYTAWEVVNTDWNGGMLYHGWSVNPAGVLMVGEYPTHDNILTVRLWKVTDDGATWTVVHTFNGRQGTLTEEKQIFHIHTVCYDKYTELFWIGTGDLNTEPSVWTYDGTTMTLIGENSQLWRACSFSFTPNYVLWGSDGAATVDGVNSCWMVRLDRTTNEIEALLTASSTMFNCEEINRDCLPFFIGCGTPNIIYLSKDGRNWHNEFAFDLNPALPDVYSWFYNFVDNDDGRCYGYITGILRHDTEEAFTHGTVILDIVN